MTSLVLGAKLKSQGDLSIYPLVSDFPNWHFTVGLIDF